MSTHTYARTFCIYLDIHTHRHVFIYTLCIFSESDASVRGMQGPGGKVIDISIVIPFLQQLIWTPSKVWGDHVQQPFHWKTPEQFNTSSVVGRIYSVCGVLWRMGVLYGMKFLPFPWESSGKIICKAVPIHESPIFRDHVRDIPRICNWCCTMGILMAVIYIYIMGIGWE